MAIAEVVGRSPEDLSLTERAALAGLWVALEMYQPSQLGEISGKPEVTVRLRRIEAIGNSVEDCIRQLKSAGVDPAAYEFSRLKPAYGGIA